MPTMRTDFDYYAVLGVSPKATAAELKQAYHLIVKIYHPDRNPGEEEECTHRMMLVNEAFDVLSNPVERAKYDRIRETEVDDDAPASPPRHRSEPAHYPPPTFRHYGQPKVGQPYDQATKSRMRERVIAGEAASLLILGLGLASYNFIAPAFTKPAAVAVAPSNAPLPPPITIVHEPTDAPMVTPTPAKPSVDKPRPHSAPVRYTRVEAVHHARSVPHTPRLTSAQKDARAAAIAAKIESAKRAAHPLE